jgi:L-fuconolactonase
VKLSEIPRKQGGRLQTEVSFYRDTLDRLWSIFGENRVLFGSDWPNSDHVAGYGETLGIVRAYVNGKGHAASEKYFWKNSIAAYRWKPRDAKQASLQ